MTQHTPSKDTQLGDVAREFVESGEETLERTRRWGDHEPGGGTTPGGETSADNEPAPAPQRPAR